MAKVTIVLSDNFEDQELDVEMSFDKPITEDTDQTPALKAAVDIMALLRGEE